MKTKFKTLIPWIVLILLVIGAGAWYYVTNRVSESEQNSYDQLIAEANTWYQGKEYSTAMEKYYAAADVIPSGYEAFKGVINILIDKNRLDDAMNLVDNSAKKVSASDQAKLYASIAYAYFQSENYDKALDAAKKGDVLDDKNQDISLVLGKIYIKQGKIDEAKSFLTNSIYTEENLSEATLLLSYVQSVSDVNLAKNTLVSVNPTDKFKTYYEDFSSILNSLTDDTKFNAAKLARVYINAGYPYLAISILEPINDQIEEYVEGLYFLGRAYLDYGEYDKAITEFDRAITLGGMEVDIFWAEAKAEYLNNNLDAAVTNYSKALAAQGKTPSEDLVKEYLDVLISSNQLLKAGDVVQSVGTNVKESYLYLYAVKINYANNSMSKVAYYLNLLSKMTLSGDELESYLYWDAKYLLDQNAQADKISDVLNQMLSENRYDPKYYLLLGKLDIAQGSAVDASNAFKKAIEYDLNGSVTTEATNLLSTVD